MTGVLRTTAGRMVFFFTKEIKKKFRTRDSQERTSCLYFQCDDGRYRRLSRSHFGPQRCQDPADVNQFLQKVN